MAIYKLNIDGTDAMFKKAQETSFEKEKILETKQIHSAIANDINILSMDGDPELMIISQEYKGWFDSNRSIDFLCIDEDANLVVIEVKRTQDGGHMELQALRYAAMVSPMTLLEAVEALAQYKKLDKEDAQNLIIDFLGFRDLNEDDFGNRVRVILVSADFSKEITTTVIWLRDSYGLDFRCIRMQPYKNDQTSLLVDVQQLIPLPEASELQVKIGIKKQAEMLDYDRRSVFSNERPNFNDEELKNELKKILDCTSGKKVIRPLIVILKELCKKSNTNDGIGRDVIKEIFIEEKISPDIGRAGNLLSRVSSFITKPKSGAIRDVLCFDFQTPEGSGATKDNYKIRPEKLDIVETVLSELK